jgi:cation transport ATPase
MISARWRGREEELTTGTTALLVGEALAGAVIAFLLASGVLLEARAAARARRELSLLADRTAQPVTRPRDSGSSTVLNAW